MSTISGWIKSYYTTLRLCLFDNLPICFYEKITSYIPFICSNTKKNQNSGIYRPRFTHLHHKVFSYDQICHFMTRYHYKLFDIDNKNVHTKFGYNIIYSLHKMKHPKYTNCYGIVLHS